MGHGAKVAAASPIRFTTDLAELRGALPPEFEINLYRIVQESLNQRGEALGAGECSVTVTRDEQRIVVRVADNGCGFDVSGSPVRRARGEGFGLSSLRERARTMSAQVTFVARPGREPVSPCRCPFEDEFPRPYFIADDHPIFRKGLCDVIEEDSALRLAGQAGNGREALRSWLRRCVQTSRSLDINMPKFAACRSPAPG